jgi:cyanate lyase
MRSNSARALFFDRGWFDAKLAEAGLSHVDVAAALGLSAAELADMWKDQRELRAKDVRILAALLDALPQEVALRAGVSTPVPQEASPGDDLLLDLAERLTRIERGMEDLKSLLLDLRSNFPGR